MNKITIAMVVKNFELHGISKVVTNYCENLDKNKYKIIILAGEPINKSLQSICAENGAIIHRLPNKDEEPILFYYSLFKALMGEKVDIVHVHGNSAIIAIEIIIAAMVGIKHRIAHSHSTSGSNEKLHKLLKPLLNIVCTEEVACGEKAGVWLFGHHNFSVLYNGVDLKKFVYNQEMRKKVRDGLGIEENDCVIGHVGRIYSVKNQEFLISIFDEYLKNNPNSRLLMVGAGSGEQKIRNIIASDINKERIIMYGETNNVADLYSAMDVFVFPSKHEGLPITLIEAQASGLPCVVSDAVTDEVLVSGEIKKLSLQMPVDKWATNVQDAVVNNISRRADNIVALKKFNNDSVIRDLERMYERIMDNEY